MDRRWVAATSVTLGLLGVLLPQKATASSGHPSCLMITDPQGDTSVGPSGVGAGPGQDASLDVRSADIATNATTFVALVRVQQLGNGDTGSATGRLYRAEFSVNGSRDYVVIASVMPDGSSFTVYGPHTAESSDTSQTKNYAYLARVTGALEVASSSVRISVPTQLLRILPGMPLRLTKVASERAVGLSGAATAGAPLSTENETSSPADETTQEASYKAGSPSCVRVA